MYGIAAEQIYQNICMLVAHYDGRNDEAQTKSSWPAGVRMTQKISDMWPAGVRITHFLSDCAAAIRSAHRTAAGDSMAAIFGCSHTSCISSAKKKLS